MNEQALDSLRREFAQAFPGEPTREHQSLSDRIRRALSWMRKALRSRQGAPVRFVELWIALNALYGQRHYEDPGTGGTEAEDFGHFVEMLLRIDGSSEIQRVCRRVSARVRSLVANPFLWNEYWRKPGRGFEPKRGILQDLEEATRSGDAQVILTSLFLRLLVLRNQIVHGSAAEDTAGNQGAVVPAIRVLEALLPAFVQVMIRHGRRTAWRPVPYPRAGTPLHR